MQEPIPNQGLPPSPPHNAPHPDLHEQQVPNSLAHDRDADLLEAESVKYNVARIVRLSSGRFALFSHHRAGALDLVKVGTIEEIADLVPTAEQCAFAVDSRRLAEPERTKKLTKLDLADLGL